MIYNIGIKLARRPNWAYSLIIFGPWSQYEITTRAGIIQHMYL